MWWYVEHTIVFCVSRHRFHVFFDSGTFAEALIEPEISTFLTLFVILDGKKIMEKFETNGNH